MAGADGHPELRGLDRDPGGSRDRGISQQGSPKCIEGAVHLYHAGSDRDTGVACGDDGSEL